MPKGKGDALSKATRHDSAQAIHRYVSGLRVNHELCYAVRRTKRSDADGVWEFLHLQQSPLDRACGLHTVLMAAMLATGLPRTRAIRFASSSRSEFKRLWTLARPSYFRGVRAAEVAELLAAAASELKTTQIKGKPQVVAAEVVEAVERDDLALIMVGNANRTYMHWLIVLGIEYREGGSSGARKAGGRKLFASALLGLDPESPAPVMSHFNWRMHLPATAARRQVYECLSADGSEAELTVIEAVVLERTG